MTIYVEKITDDKKIVGITKSAKLASEMGFKYSFEEQDIEQAYDGSLYLAGYAPVKPEPTIEEQNEAIRATREQLYIQTSDKLRNDYLEAVARGAENVEELKTAWLESKDKIREENPYVVEVIAEAVVEPVEESEVI